MKNNHGERSLITIFHANQCDKKKCTGIKVWRFFKQNRFRTINEMKFINQVHRIPRYSLQCAEIAGRGVDLSVLHQEKVISTGFAHITILAEHDSLLCFRS